MDPVSCLKEQLERNKSLMDDVDDLDSNIATLRGYSKKLKLETNSSNKQQQTEITSCFMSLASNNGMFSNRSQQDIDKLERVLTHDDVHLPEAGGSSYIHVPCPGCGQQFKRYGTTFERAYYIHCIKDCYEYQKLRRTRRCDVCSKYFLNAWSMARHNCNGLSRPSWMPPNVYRRGVQTNHVEDANCPGCDVVIKNATTSDIRSYSFEYAYHVIECEDYKKLDRIKECIDCGYKFMNAISYSIHRSSIHETHMTYHCQVCNVDVGGYNKFVTHSNDHPDYLPFKCTSCDRAFKKKENLRRHLRTVCLKDVEINGD